jgi:hypothetical protein
LLQCNGECASSASTSDGIGERAPANLLRQCPQPLIFRPHEEARQSRAGEQERSSVSLPAMLTVRNIADHDHAPGPQLDRHLAPFQKIGNSCAQ